MNKFVISIDLDGTLLRPDHTVSTFSSQTLKTLENMGHIIILNTGRPYRISDFIYKQIGLSTPMLNNNGAYGHHPKDKHWKGTFSFALPFEDAKEILELQQSLNIGWIGMETPHSVYTTTRDIPKTPFFPVPDNLKIIKHPSDLVEQPLAFSWFSTLEEQVFIKEAVNKHLKKPLEIRTWGGDLPSLYVSPLGIHKATGLKKMIDILGVSKENVIAFGDEENDKEMLQFAKYGIAMKNAIPDIRAVADDVTHFSNEKDGVAHYLKDFFNLHHL